MVSSASVSIVRFPCVCHSSGYIPLFLPRSVGSTETGALSSNTAMPQLAEGSKHQPGNSHAQGPESHVILAGMAHLNRSILDRIRAGEVICNGSAKPEPIASS